jgi:hypothetical protein
MPYEEKKRTITTDGNRKQFDKDLITAFAHIAQQAEADLAREKAASSRLKKLVAYSFGALGFLMQGGAVIGLPAYVLFFGGSSWWLLAFFPLGFAGMIPLSIMNSMLKDEKRP